MWGWGEALKMVWVGWRRGQTAKDMMQLVT
jgi:hypothetical protein